MSAAKQQTRLAALQLAVFDIDGVFTDGRFYLSNDGIESKSFHTHDGYGIKALLAAGIEVAIISGRSSNAVSLRMQELKVRHTFQGCTDKVAVFSELATKLKIAAEHTVYTGDDLPDLPLLRQVGFAIGVANASDAIKSHCDYITEKPGGAGAVREICDLILTARQAAQ